MNNEKLSRRDFLRLGAMTAAGLTLFGCAPAATSTPAQQAAAATATTAPEATAAMAEATATMAPEATATTAAASGEKVTLSFWNMPFVTQEVSPQYVTQWRRPWPKLYPT